MPNWTFLCTLLLRAKVLCEQESLHATLDLFQKTSHSKRYRTKRILDACKSSQIKLRPSRGVTMVVGFWHHIQNTSPYQQRAIQTQHQAWLLSARKVPNFLLHEGWRGPSTTICKVQGVVCQTVWAFHLDMTLPSAIVSSGGTQHCYWSLHPTQ
jgi:hypothetical protein